MSSLHLAEALSRPLLFHPAKLEMILAAIGDRVGFQAGPPSPEASRLVGRPSETGAYRVERGIAFVPIVGSLVNRGAYIGASSGVVSYEGLAAQLRTAAADGSVHSIILDFDSGGGEAGGMSRLAAQIRELRKSKRIVAFVDDVAASAAYAIAASTSEIVVSPTSIVGSIGVVLAHVDRSGELAAKGHKVSLIHAGAHKIDGNAYGPLSDQVRADLQAEVASVYDHLVETVAAGRPSLSTRAIRETEARTFIGAAAIKAGLADRIATLDEVVASLSTTRSAAPAQRATIGASMTPTPAADVEKRNRITGILQCEEARQRPAAAHALADSEERVPLALARKVLASMPLEGVTGGVKADAIPKDAFAHLGPSLRHAFEQNARTERPKSGLSIEVERMAAQMHAESGGVLAAPAGAGGAPGGASLASQKSGLSAAMDEVVAQESRKAGR